MNRKKSSNQIILVLKMTPLDEESTKSASEKTLKIIGPICICKRGSASLKRKLEFLKRLLLASSLTITGNIKVRILAIKIFLDGVVSASEHLTNELAKQTSGKSHTMFRAQESSSKRDFLVLIIFYTLSCEIFFTTTKIVLFPT